MLKLTLKKQNIPNITASIWNFDKLRVKIFTLRKSITDKINELKTLTICETHKRLISTANKELSKINKKKTRRLSSYHGCKTNHLQILWLQRTHSFCSWIGSSGRAEQQRLSSAPLSFHCNLMSGYRSHVKEGELEPCRPNPLFLHPTN